MSTTPIRDTCEFLEERFGEAINAREQGVLPYLATYGGLGPPDLCWIRKAQLDGAGNDDERAKPQGCYHFVLGLDVSSEACIAAYFGSLVAQLESPGVFRELLARFVSGARGLRWWELCGTSRSVPPPDVLRTNFDNQSKFLSESWHLNLCGWMAFADGVFRVAYIVAMMHLAVLMCGVN